MSDMSLAFPSSFELWDFVSAFEDGALPTSACTEDALASIAVWYLSVASPAEAMRRLEAGLRRNHLRFAARSVALGYGAGGFAEVWASVLRRVLGMFGAADPVAVANRLMPKRAVEIVEEREAA